jgi:hypothetical protein
MWIRRLTLAVSLAVFAAFTASATDNVVLYLFITTAKQDSPVKIVGFRLPNSATGDEGPSEMAEPPEQGPVLVCRWCPQVLLRNTTPKQIKNVSLQGLMGDPNRPEGTNEVVHGLGILTESRLGQPSPYVIAPNGDASFGDNALWPSSMAIMAASAVNSNCLHVAVAVWKVEFWDGTLWMSDREQEQSQWKESLKQENTIPCKDSSAVDLRQLHRGTGTRALPVRIFRLGITQSYSAACPVQWVNGEFSMGHCAW